MNKFLAISILYLSTSTTLAAEAPATSIGHDSFSELLSPLIETRRLPGYFLSIRQAGEDKIEKSQGFADERKGVQPSAETIFAIGSMTEPLTATAVMLLVDRGQVNLSDRLTEFLPAFSGLKVAADGSYESELSDLAEPITLDHLLTHRAGFTLVERFSPTLSDVQKTYRSKGIFQKQSEFTSLAENISALAEVPLSYQPGNHASPSVSYDVLARIIEIVSGQSYLAFLQKELLDPLGMIDTHFKVPREKLTRVAAMHEPVVWGYNVPGTPKMYRQSVISKRTSKANELVRGSTGLKSSASDYLKFLDFLLGEQSSSGVSMTTSNRLNLLSKIKSLKETNSSAVAQSSFVLRQGAYNTAFWLDLPSRISGVFMTQMNPAQFQVGEELLDLTANNFKKDS